MAHETEIGVVMDDVTDGDRGVVLKKGDWYLGPQRVMAFPVRWIVVHDQMQASKIAEVAAMAAAGLSDEGVTEEVVFWMGG